MPWFLPFLVWTAVAAVWHEAGHAVAARAGGLRVRAFQIGVGRPFVRLGPVSLAPWPLGLGVDVDDGDLARASATRRAALHAAGPLANLLLAGVLLAAWAHGWARPTTALGAYVNLVLGTTNLLPLPFLDGGWLVTLGLRCLDAAPLREEATWHQRWAPRVWSVAAVATLLLTWHAGA